MRGKLDKEVRELKMRAAKCLECFKPTEAALREAGVPFQHPMIEQRERAVQARDRMLEFREMAVGAKDDSAPVAGEVEGLRRDLEEFKRRNDAG